eukprot:gene5823-9646_t
MKTILFLVFLVVITLAQEKTQEDPPLKVERVKEMSVEDFLYKHAHKRQPVIFEGIVDKWNAMKKWDFDFFSKNYGNLKVPVFKNPATDKIKVKVRKLKNFLKKLPKKRIVSHYQFSKTMPSLLKDIGKTPIYFIGNFFELFAKYKILQTPFDFKYLFIGGENANIGLRRNIYATNGWNVIIKGEQEWTLIPPRYSKLIRNDPTIDIKDFKKIKIITKPGDVLFIPGRWHFKVKTLKPSIYLEFNYVDGSNFHSSFNSILHDYKSFDVKYIRQLQKRFHSKEINENLNLYSKIAEYSGHGQDDFIKK